MEFCLCPIVVLCCLIYPHALLAQEKPGNDKTLLTKIKKVVERGIGPFEAEKQVGIPAALNTTKGHSIWEIRSVVLDKPFRKKIPHPPSMKHVVVWVRPIKTEDTIKIVAVGWSKCGKIYFFSGEVPLVK